MIKFHCKHCNGKIGVKEEYAGKRVRCPKCKEPVRVPEPEVEEDFELEMISEGDPFAGGAASDLAALAAMEEGADAQIPGYEAPPRGNPCPSCGTACAPRAKLCTHCGYNFKTKGATQTHVQAAAPSYGTHRAGGSSSGEMGWLDKQLSETSTLVILLFGCCCSLSLIVGIIGLIICKDPQARRNAGILVIIQATLNALAIIRAVTTEMPVTP